MTAIELGPLNSPSSLSCSHTCEMPGKSKNFTAASFFSDPSFLKQWSDIESTLASPSTRISADSDSDIGWVEGRVHETRSTQKEVEVLLVRLLDPDQKQEAHEALRIFITCPELTRFVFAINQVVKVSLRGARVVNELVPHGSGQLPFSLVFSNFLCIQSIRGGPRIRDGDVIDTRPENRLDADSSLLESEISHMSIDDTLIASTPGPRTSPKLQDIPVGDSTIADVPNDYTVYPPLVSLTEGMMTPLLGVVETLKPPFTTSTDELCVGITIADASSYECRRGFRLTCFTHKSRLARDLPNPSEGDVMLFKSVKITKFSNILIGTVFHNKLDWIVYHPKTHSVTVPQHSKSEPAVSFYSNLEGRKEMFKQFIIAMESGPWKNGQDFK